MNANEPVAWMQTWENQDGSSYHTIDMERIGINDIPLYIHPHPDNLGLAESIIKQQELQIEALKAEVKQWKDWKQSLNGWSKK